MIYINGVKASKKDLRLLVEHIKQGRAQLLSITTTPKKATSIKVNILY